MSWTDAHIVVWIFAFAFASDLVRASFEIIVNLYYRRHTQSPVPLRSDEVAVVVACHNSADSIEATLDTLPAGFTVYCVANNCTDTTVEILEALGSTRPGLVIVDVDYPEKSKTKAALLGALQASQDGFTHILLLDDDVCWPQDRTIEVLDRSAAVTAVPIIPHNRRELIEQFQVFEYIGTNLNKRVQMYFAGNITWASGAAAIYRLDVFLDVMRMHDGEFAGEDIQCSYLHHYAGYPIDFLEATVVSTDVPRTPVGWWRQRAHSWDVSFMFLHIGLLLRVLFRRGGKGPGWWIRLMTFYRIYDALLVFVKLALPLAVLRFPVVGLLFFASAYMILSAQYLMYPMFFPRVDRTLGPMLALRRAIAFVLFPVYTLVTWVSRLTAIVRVIYKKLHPRPPLGPFIDQGYEACTRSRVVAP
ncbi:MAG: glycosyltransferase family 2 protein [Longimicrobiales bacterium]